MRRNAKKRLIPLALALVLAIVGAALAVPSINVTVQELGQGSAVIASSIKDATVKWNLDDNPDYLDSTGEVTVDLSSSNNTILSGGKIYVKLYSGTTLIAVGSATLASGTTTYTVDLTIVSDPNGDGLIGLDEFDVVYVVYQGP